MTTIERNLARYYRIIVFLGLTAALLVAYGHDAVEFLVIFLGHAFVEATIEDVIA